MFIINYEFWSSDIVNSESFPQEINDICTEEIKVCHCFNLYNILGGDNILKLELGLDIEDKENNDGNAKPNDGNNPNGGNKPDENGDDNDKKDEEEEEEEEGEDDRKNQI